MRRVFTGRLVALLPVEWLRLLLHTFRRVWTCLQSNAPNRQAVGRGAGGRRPAAQQSTGAAKAAAQFVRRFCIFCCLSVLSVRLSLSLSVCLCVCFCFCFSVLCSGKNFVHWLQTCFNCFVTECDGGSRERERERETENGNQLEGASHSHADSNADSVSPKSRQSVCTNGRKLRLCSGPFTCIFQFLLLLLLLSLLLFLFSVSSSLAVSVA